MAEPGWRRLWWLKHRHLVPSPWERLLVHRELAKRRAFAKGRLLGDALAMFREGRLSVGEHVLLEPHVWLTGVGHIGIGAYSFLNRGVMVAAIDRVTIGEHCMIANGCLITDGDHDVSDPERPITHQGYVSRGPTSIGDNCWLGANVVVTSGVTIGERCVIGANSTVTRDIPAWSLAVGSPARVVRSLRE